MINTQTAKRPAMPFHIISSDADKVLKSIINLPLLYVLKNQTEDEARGRDRGYLTRNIGTDSVH